LQVLSSSDWDLAREAVAAVLNASASVLTRYPLSTKQAVDLFREVWAYDLYRINATTDWNEAEVVEYLQMLHSGSAL